MNSIDLGRAFKAPFADKDWPMKTLLGFVWALLGVTAPAIYGAQLEYIRNVSKGREELPDWSDFGGKWVQGFMVLIAGLIYFLPVFILLGIFMVPVVVASASGGDSDALGALLGGGACIFILIATVYAMAMSVFFYAAQVNYAMSGSFGAFFDISGIMGRVRGGTGFFTAWLYAVVISFALSAAMSVVSTVTGGIGGILYPAVTYLTVMMTGHVLGQWAARAYGVIAAAPVGYTPPAAAGYAPPAPPAYEPPAAPTYEPPAAPAAPAYQPPVPPAATVPPTAPVPPAAPAPEVPTAPEAPSAPNDPDQQ